MSAQSLATARLMETWAHGLDCFAALNATPRDTERLRHVAWLGFRTLPYAFAVADQEPPAPLDELRLVLTSPSGAIWHLGTDQAPSIIRGPAGTGVASPPTDYAHPHNRRSVAKAHWHGPLSRWFEPSCRRLTLRPGQKSYRLTARSAVLARAPIGVVHLRWLTLLGTASDRAATDEFRAGARSKSAFGEAPRRQTRRTQVRDRKLTTWQS